MPAGQPKKIESPEKMWSLFMDYKDHELANPIKRRDYVGKDGRPEDTKMYCALTMEGFSCYLCDLGIIDSVDDYVKNKNGLYDAYSPIITRIKNYIYNHNFKGAGVGLLKENLIARQLGIKDKQEIEHKGELNIPPVPDIGKRG